MQEIPRDDRDHGPDIGAEGVLWSGRVEGGDLREQGDRRFSSAGCEAQEGQGAELEQQKHRGGEKTESRHSHDGTRSHVPRVEW